MTDDTLALIKRGLDALRTDGLVEPMMINLTPNTWGWLKSRSLPGHPNPGNANGGWSHPKKYEVNNLSRGRFGMGVGVKMDEPNWIPETETRSDKQILDEIITPILQIWEIEMDEEEENLLVEMGRDIGGRLQEISISRIGRRLAKKYPNVAIYEVVANEAGELQFRWVSVE